MKSVLIIVLVLLSQNLGLTQNFEEKRVLRPLLQEADTTSVKVRYDKSNQIIFLSQRYQEIKEDTTFVITENYRKGFWSLYRFKKVKSIVKNDTIVHRSIDGKQYRFNDNGQITYIDNYINGEKDKNSFEIEYYTTGTLKFIYEMKTRNFLDYRYPDGKKYNFGDFKNGEGRVVHLNDKGIPCLENITTGNKTVVKILCEDYK